MCSTLIIRLGLFDGENECEVGSTEYIYAAHIDMHRSRLLEHEMVKATMIGGTENRGERMEDLRSDSPMAPCFSAPSSSAQAELQHQPRQ